MTKCCDSMYARASHWQRVKRSLSRSWLYSGSPGHMAQAPPLPLTGRKRECPSRRGGGVHKRRDVTPATLSHALGACDPNGETTNIISAVQRGNRSLWGGEINYKTTSYQINHQLLLFNFHMPASLCNMKCANAFHLLRGLRCKKKNNKKTTATKTTAILNMDSCPLQFRREKREFILKRGAMPQRFGEEINSLWIIKCLFLKILWRWRNAHTRKKKEKRKKLVDLCVETQNNPALILPAASVFPTERYTLLQRIMRGSWRESVCLTKSVKSHVDMNVNALWLQTWLSAFGGFMTVCHT